MLSNERVFPPFCGGLILIMRSIYAYEDYHNLKFLVRLSLLATVSTFY